MERGRRGARWTAWALILWATAVCGCAPLNVPRIDPSGERIFAEPLVAADAPYRDLPGPPRYNQRVDLVVCPHEAVAPVGGEVIVLAGVLAADGYLRTNERVEWMLDPGGPGRFVDVGRGTATDLLAGDFARPRKIDNTFAVGSTSRRYLRLTRGTADPTDDVYVQRGQAWVSVTSSVQGTSRVTAFAPGVYDWQRRKQTATIHWVDAQWSLPPPSINPAGSRHVFTTTVTRQTDGSPCVGWQVRYEILDGPPAGFAPDGVRAIEVATDDLGQASAEIFQQEPTPGTNRVAIQVIRPAGSDPGGGKRLEVGYGATTKTWSAPDIAVRKTGPAVATVGATVTYRIEVSNPGDLPANDVLLTDAVPAGLAYLSSRPEGEAAGRSVRWRLGTLEAGASRSVEVDFRADRQGSVTNCAEVSAGGGLEAKDCATTTVGAPSLDVQVYGPQQPVIVGEDVTFRIVITNRGQVPAAGLVIKDRFEEGLQHAAAPSPIERDLGVELAPGQSQEIGVTLRVVKPGRWCNTAEVLSQGRVVATAQAWVTAVEAAPPQPGPTVQPGPAGPPAGAARMSVRMTGPEVRTEGETAEFVIEVANTGERPLTDVKVVAEFDRNFTPAAATGGFAERPADDLWAPFVWTAPTLPAGRTTRFVLQCTCSSAAPSAGVRASVTSQEGAGGEDQVDVEILKSPELAPAELEMTIEDRHDPIDVGKEKTFVIRVVNTGRMLDRQVTLVVTLPPAMEVVRFKTVGPPSTDYVAEGQRIRFDPVDALFPGETLEYRVRVATKQPGDARLIAELTSQSLPEPKTVEEGTLINPGG